MSAIATGEETALHSAVRFAIAALRSIRGYQVRTAMLFGLLVSAANITSFYVMLVVDAKAVSHAVVFVDMVISDQVRALVLMAAIVIADYAVDRGAPMRRCYVAAALCGSVIGILASTVTSQPFMRWMMRNGWPEHWLRGVDGFMFTLVFALTHWGLIASAAVFLYADRRAARKTQSRLRAAELDRVHRSRLALESRLQAMQARVEPQFLFNTLAQVERLYEIDPALAGRMLDDLIAYLRAAMPQMRDSSSTVGRETELARAYLDIIRLRPGGQLHVSIDVAADAAALTMPPMMMMPLLDVGIARRCLEVDAEATIRISAATRGGRLYVTFVNADSGTAPEVDVDAIAALRQRLAALYHGDASLQIRRVGGEAIEAVLDLPLERPVAGPTEDSRGGTR
ncbi:MAG: histidine kinase [Betaproteobacteria bacterium]